MANPLMLLTGPGMMKAGWDAMPTSGPLGMMTTPGLLKSGGLFGGLLGMGGQNNDHQPQNASDQKSAASPLPPGAAAGVGGMDPQQWAEMQQRMAMMGGGGIY